jgi:hypothetical protein
MNFFNTLFFIVLIISQLFENGFCQGEKSSMKRNYKYKKKTFCISI